MSLVKLNIARGVTGTLPTSNYTSGITEADQWRITTSFNGSSNPITANWERNDTVFAKIGTGMSESSGIFTFPSTGIYKITFSLQVYNASTSDGVYAQVHATTNDSSYSLIVERHMSLKTSGDTEEGYAITTFDCTDTSTHKLKFIAADFKSSSVINGDSTKSETYVIFEKLGAT